MTIVRSESPADFAAIRAVNEAAFGGPAEADLVERLRADGDMILSLVADNDGDIVGHCGFSRLTINADQTCVAVSLAPVAVLPAVQRQGIGIQMIPYGLERLKADGEALVFVLGESDYYRRFGFDAPAASAFVSPYNGPYFQLLRLSDGGPANGEVRYAPAFAAL